MANSAMGCCQRVVALVFLMAMAAHAAVYKVGDSAGWTTIGNVDYKQWSATKSFQIGDVISNSLGFFHFFVLAFRVQCFDNAVFEYNAQFHNVMQVTHPMYKACNATAPLATYTTGNDSITITRKGHHFFFCGVPGHCQAGQKVDINVLRTSETAPIPSPSEVSPPPSVPAVGVPAPSSNSGISLKASRGSFIKLALAMAAFAVFVSGFN
ncbi:Plastocyanin-like protein [Corchorus capsularis]|uniref:Plastocyanin-like protein n=1 Tax=Corchorus capsularis TaxID=210143 RepID=A0A1R3GT22_COCAP|nr:Plastocyanin-like protein [Corchorus capsularis]